MAYTRYIYNRVFWKNKSESLETPLGQTLLNRMDSAIYNLAENLDIVHGELSAEKFDRADADKVIVGMPSWDPGTGILSFQFYDGTTFQVDFNVEKIPVSFSMDSAGVITMATADGTEWTADIGDVMPDYVFEDSDRIVFARTRQEDGSYKVTADIRRHSITDSYLQPGYLASVTEQAAQAEAEAQAAAGYADNAAHDAKLAQSYAIGGSGIREGEDADNAKTSREAAEQAARDAQEALEHMQEAQVTGVKGDAESSYRTGEVNLTPADIGLGNYSATAINLVQEDASGNSQVNVIKTGEMAHAGRLVVSSAGNFGVYDETWKKWLLKSDISGNVEVYGVAESADRADSTTRLKSISGGNGSVIITNPGSGTGLLPSMGGDNYLNLGGAATYSRWGQVYSTNSVISTSDRTLKHDISYMGKKSVYDTQLTDEQTEQLIMGIKPAVFKLNDGTSGRPHHGILSQDLEQTLEQIGIDHGAFIKSPKTRLVEKEDGTQEYEVIKDEYIYSVRYEELIADIIRFVQLQQERITDLETRLRGTE